MIQQSYETPLKYVECAICKRETSQGHSEEITKDLWICSWCCCGGEIEFSR